MYDIDGYLVDNPVNRYALGDRSGLRANPDGSLTIYLQAESPADEWQANWLPSPKAGPFKVALRLYAPAESVIEREWVPPAITRAD